MRAVLYVPYSNGDCKEGFKYEGIIDQKTYSDMVIEDYERHKQGVDYMVGTCDGIGMNISRNRFGKEKRKYNQQTYYYQPVEAMVFDKDNGNIGIDALLDYFNSGKQFVIIMALLNVSSADPSGELESDIRSWTSESLKITRTNKMTTDEKIKSLSKKSLKLAFKDSKSVAILKDCKMVNVYSRNKFALLVKGIEFLKDDEISKKVNENIKERWQH